MLTTFTPTIDRVPLGSPSDATAQRIERLERRIAETCMTATLEMDWDQLHRRSRDIIEQITQELDPIQQIATARRIRVTLAKSEDKLGLRALRLATAAPMVGWLQNQSARQDAQSLGRLLATDQHAAIPELAHLEAELAQARGRSE